MLVYTVSRNRSAETSVFVCVLDR